MSEKAQIDVQQGNKTIRIFSGWGIPRNVLPALRAAASAGYSKPLDIARYTVDVSSMPWRVRQTKMPHYKLIDNGDGTLSPAHGLTPAVTRSFRIGV